MMNVNPFMVVIPTNVLCIQPPKYHDNDDLVIHIRQLTKVCVTNGEDINDHKLQYFLNLNYLKGKVANWFAKKRLIQWRHGMKYNRMLVDLVRFVAKDKRL
jgi:hypothetical protein